MGDERPAWWDRNSKLRDTMDLPEYEPPRFQDGVYTHTVVAELAARFDCEIRFAGFDTRYPDDWHVVVDGTKRLEIGRYRDDQANTVYKMDSSEFRAKLAALLEDQ